MIFYSMTFGFFRAFINLLFLFATRDAEIGGWGKSTSFVNKINLIGLPISITALMVQMRYQKRITNKRKFIQLILFG